MQKTNRSPETTRTVLWTRGVTALIGMLGVIFAAAIMGAPM